MEYKKITEVEMIEEPSENATVLAEDNGALKRVPYKNVGGGSTSGGVFLFEVTGNETDGYSSSATYTEIGAALAAGSVVYCVYGGSAYPFVSTTNPEILSGVSTYSVALYVVFGGWQYGGSTFVYITIENDRVSVEEVSYTVAT